jgi:hypothetical protein
MNARILELKNGTKKDDDDGRMSVDITSDVRKLYSFANTDTIFRHLMRAIQSEVWKNGPYFEVPPGLEQSFQSVLLQDSEIQRYVSEILFEGRVHISVYGFCFFYIVKNMETWIRDNMNNPQLARNSLPFAIVNPTEGEYYVEKHKGSINYSLYFVPTDEDVLNTYSIMLYEESPSFDVMDTVKVDTPSITLHKTHGAKTESLKLNSPFWDMIKKKQAIDEATDNTRLADKHRVNYIDYVTPPLPKELAMSEMTEQQIILNGALAVNNTQTGVRANERGVTNRGNMTYSQFTTEAFKLGVLRGYQYGTPTAARAQDPSQYKRSDRVYPLKPGETVNRNPHANLIINTRELEDDYAKNLCAETGVPYSRYRPFEKGSYRKDDNTGESETMTATILDAQERMTSIFFMLYEHTLGVIDDSMLTSYRTWEKNIAFQNNDLETLRSLGGGNPQKLVEESTMSGDMSERASYLIREISQLTPFDIAMFGHMNDVEMPNGEYRHLVSMTFSPISSATMATIPDYLSIYKEGILQPEIIQALRNRLHLPDEEDETATTAVGDSERPTKRRRTTKEKKGKTADDAMDTDEKEPDVAD